MDSIVDNGIRPLSDREFRRFQRLIHRESGIYLSDAKKPLVVGRLSRRLRALGLSSFASYLECVEPAGAAERTEMLDCICTNETRFFREPRQFQFLDEQVIPTWKSLAAEGHRPKSVRAWSAACSTGEEPFSLAMLLRAHLSAEAGWVASILASDLSTRVLAKAREAVWPVERSQDIPLSYRKAFMMRGIRSAEGTMRARPELQTIVEFRQINLSASSYEIEGLFDLIFCRNVLIYFNQETKAAVIERIIKHLAPGGLLLLGHSETISATAYGLQHAGPSTYRRGR